MKYTRLGEICTLNYGKGLRKYESEPHESLPVRVFGTNGPIGWAPSSLYEHSTIIIGRKGAYRGVNYTSAPSWTIDTAYYLTLRTDDVDLKWLYYRLLLVNINRMDTGSAIPSTKREDFYSVSIQIPPLHSQQRIASILSAYDDLIENNQRRIQLLERAARLLYKEWFVHLRFPGHEHVKIVDGVPEGWEKSTVGDKSTLIRGKSYKSSELVESGGKPFVNLKCVARHGGFRLDGLKRFSGPHREDQVLVPGDIVIAVTDMTRERHIVAHPARVPAAMDDEAVFSMDTVKLIPNETVDSSWFYYFLRYSNFSKEVREQATGTNVLHLKPKQITDYVAVFPPHRLQEQFGETSQSILAQQDNLIIQNERLAKARDFLLPRLMNGEVAV